MKHEPRFHVSCQEWGDIHDSLTNSALWLMMGLFCLLLKEGEGRKEEDGERSRGQFPRLRPQAWTRHHHGHNYLSEREREKEVKDLRGRTFLHILPPRRYSHQISQRNALILTSCLWESLRQKLGLDWPLEQTNAALAQEHVNTGQPQILKQTWRFIFPKPLKKTAAVPTNAHQSQRWWPS